MARLDRKTLKIFAKDATNNGVFGSGQDGTKVITNNIATLQSKPAWYNGWLDAIIGTKKFPPVEEFQSVQYVHSYMTAYLFQEGIPEYDSATTYYTKSIVRKSGTYEIYGSKINDNVGNPLPSGVDDDNWEYLQDLSIQAQQATETVAGIAEIATAAETKAGTDDQRIVTPLKLKPFALRPGMGIDWWLSALPDDSWIWADGKTIGNASSNATNRANDDTYDLFVALWNDYGYSGTNANEAAGELQVKTSAGANVARGVSAAADWAANRQLAVIDMRGRARFGKDNMGGSAAGRLSGQTGGINGNKLGNAGGEEVHQLTTAEIPGHTHDGSGMTAASAGAHTHSVKGYGGSGSPVGLTWGGSVQSGTATTESAGAHTHTISGNTGSTGGGGNHNTVPPGKVCNYILKL